MEDGVKEEPTKPKEVKSAEKAGWLKKSSGKFLSSYKDRYIQLDRTVIAVYENEELTTCLEKLDLDNYDTCHELKSPFKKKHRLVLIRSPKSGNKVQDVKLQAPTPEEKEAWIEALSRGINKAKNKIFDEVKVDENCSLEHVTRNRPKGNRGRRPPTRIHMKEVANVSSDGILRLDLDGEVSMLNGTHSLNTEGDKQTETSKPPVAMNNIPEEDIDEEVTPQKKVVKPPMPPSKDNKPSESHKEDEPKNEEPAPQKKILTPPMPPTKESKPCVSVDGAAVKESKVETEADSTDSSEPTSSTKSIQPPTPPSKNAKPNQPATPAAVTTEEKETQEKNEEVDDKGTEVDEASNKKKDQDKLEDVEVFVLSKKVMKPQVVMWDSPTLVPQDAEQDGQNSKKATETTGEVVTSVEPSKLDPIPVSTPESAKKSPGPPAPPKKKPLKAPAKNEDSLPQSDPVVVTNSTILPSEKDDIKLTIPEPKTEPTGDVSSEELEEKSLDSGQHSGDESETGDQVTPSSAKLKVSSQGLDLEISEDDLEPSDSKAESLEEPSSETPSTTPETSVPNAHPTPSQCTNKTLYFTVPLKHSSKARSASLGNMLVENEENMESEGKGIPIKLHGADVKDLQRKVSLEIEQTGQLLNAIASGRSGETGEGSPEILLSAAMEKLRKADQFLREAKSLKDLKKSKRLSL